MKRKLLYVLLPLSLLICLVLSGLGASRTACQMIEKADSRLRTEIESRRHAREELSVQKSVPIP
ncbi:hypothetical protein V1224_12175 [Lachnospiraceae bacterium JLR.KK008]